MTCHRIVDDGIVLAIRLTPRAGRDALDGIVLLADGSEVAVVRVRAAPVEGAANDALVAFLARTLKVPKRSITLIAGARARLKQVHITGDASWLSRRIEDWPR